ncbi:MAG: extracellular solute-binding protein [Phycisphaerales bacterium]|nr:extracellular solute-binding protein [Phycisphaerales bacterium]
MKIRIHRFRALLTFIPALVMLSACNPTDESQDQPRSVVLYTSADDEFARLVVEDFTSETGISVQLVGDTEATKTTGLIARLKAEANNPQCDVWWSSEPFGTIDLANSGILMPAGITQAADWPSELVAEDRSWIGFASRPRVIAYATDRVESPPTTLRDFAQPQWKGRIGMARPQFGTTRGHMGILASRWGLAEFERWLTMLKNNGIRLYDGNATVVRAIAMGEIDLGLTDTDDVWAGQRNGWKVDCVYESFDSPMTLETLNSKGPTLLPNTIGIVNGTTNIENARLLADYLLSPRIETLLAESTSRNLPANPKLVDLFHQIAPTALTQSNPNREALGSIYPNFSDAESMIPEALDVCERVLR